MEKFFATATNPQSHTVEWTAEPHFVKVGNLLVTVITTDRAKAAKIVSALQ